MNLGGDNPRINPVKLMLGSLEFPVVQWTIEEEWSRFYFSEGYRIEPSMTHLWIKERIDEESVDTMLRIPQYMNEILEWRVLNDQLVARCKHPHNLWIENVSSVLPGVTWGDVEVLCGPMGRLSITSLFRTNRLTFMSLHEFAVPVSAVEKVEDVTGRQCGYLYVPTIPSPTCLCEFLTFALRRSSTIAVKRVEYTPRMNKAHFIVDTFPDDCTSFLHVSLHASDLLSVLGYTSTIHERRFFRRPPDAPSEFTTPNLFQERYDTPPLYMPSEQVQGWKYVRLQPGWYTPQHRPMLTGQPLRFPVELELALNRLYFPIPERIPPQTATAHFLIFQDPCGQNHQCPVYAGMYNPSSISRHLEKTMTSLCKVSSPRTVFTVDYDPSTERFTFACQLTTEDGDVVPAPFSLMFNHPATFDPARLGFEQVPLNGSSMYTSTIRVVFPHFEIPQKSEDNDSVRWHSNVYRVTEVSHQKIFRLHASPPAAMTGIVESYDAELCELRLRTYVGQLPFSHGLQASTVIRLAPCRPVDVFVYEDGQWSERRKDNCPVAPRWGRSAVVMQQEDGDDDPLVLRLHVRSTPRLCECLDQAIQIQPVVSPFNFCFGTLPESIHHTSLGFPPGAVQWGIDGSMVTTSHGRLPPFDAPYVHSLDHPDYVLLYLVERNKKATSLQHSEGTNNTSPFAKLVLYPLFREERMLPRDTTLLSGESMSQFTFRFSNPDGTPYHFHGAEFSFSLNFICVNAE